MLHRYVGDMPYAVCGTQLVLYQPSQTKPPLRQNKTVRPFAVLVFRRHHLASNVGLVPWPPVEQESDCGSHNDLFNCDPDVYLYEERFRRWRSQQDERSSVRIINDTNEHLDPPELFITIQIL
jgi:hypothetical protein